MAALTRSTRRLAPGLAAVARASARALGYDLVHRDYYSALPDVSTLPADTWTRERPLAGVCFDPEAWLEFIGTELAPALREFDPRPNAAADLAEYWADNDLYGSIDAAMLFAMVRRYRPQRIIELGSGMSSLVIGAARATPGGAARATPGGAARATAAQDTGYSIYDPFPREELVPALTRFADLHRTGTTEVPIDRFGQLRSGDLLFVDTTHTVKIAGDVDRIVLDVLPTLAPGVLVHFHDVFLPWEYPREFVVERRFYWAEQYLLQAFLAFNREFEILFSTHALYRRHQGALAALVPTMMGARPAALWLRRIERDGIPSRASGEPAG